MTYGFVICAGNQSRFKTDTPKALMQIKDKTILDINVENMTKFCDKVFVVCSQLNYSWFDSSKYNIITISSGNGCGDAVMQAIEDKLNIVRPGDKCFIQWGDSIQEENTFNYLVNSYSGRGLSIPVEYVYNPYVCLVQSELNRVRVFFSKYNEVNCDAGYHDMSLFYGDISDIYTACKSFYFTYTYGYGYEHRHGNEFTFLDLLNEGFLNGQIVVTHTKHYCFNTVEEFNQIVDQIS